MIVPSHVDIENVFDDQSAILTALNRGADEAVKRHKLLGQSIAVWRDGKAVVIPADEIELDDEPATPSNSKVDR
jgi:hypothetical protein